MGACIIPISGADAELLVKPVDTLVMAGSVTSLNCSTNSSNPYNNALHINWYNSSGCADVTWECFSSYNIYNNNIMSISERFWVIAFDTSDEHTVNLVINQTEVIDAGSYVCYDASGQFAMAQLAVIGN